MATYNHINLDENTYRYEPPDFGNIENQGEEVTKVFKFALMGKDYQTTDNLYRANLERLAVLVDALVFNSPVAAPSGEECTISYKVNAENEVTRGNDMVVNNISQYSNIDLETGSNRRLYFIKED